MSDEKRKRRLRFSPRNDVAAQKKKGRRFAQVNI